MWRRGRLDSIGDLKANVTSQIQAFQDALLVLHYFATKQKPVVKEYPEVVASSSQVEALTVHWTNGFCIYELSHLSPLHRHRNCLFVRLSPC
jgi:hypothetical protein